MQFYTNQWKHIFKLCVLPLIFTLFLVTMVFSWGSTGHRIINLKASMHLPASMSALKADSMFYYTHASDADGRKDYSDTSYFSEPYRHYIDIDIYPNYHSIPHNLDSMNTMFGRSYVRSNGTLPWAIVLTFDSLTAQLRRGNTAKAESTMADLGHYIGDAHQPLHNTENYNGDNTGNHGIHSRYESSMVDRFQSSIVINWDSVHYVTSPLDYAFEFIYHSNSLVDSVLMADDYAKTATGWNGTGSVPPAYYDSLWFKTSRFTKDQFQRATIMLASYWYTAWVNAQPIEHDTITTSVYGNGTITPSGLVVVQSGNDTSFTFTPQNGYHVDSVFVDGVLVDSTSSYTFVNVHQNHTLYVVFKSNSSLFQCNISEEWNMVSLPVNVVDNRKSVLFPSATSSAFAFTTGYEAKDSLMHGMGYWLKFDTAQIVSIPGIVIDKDTVTVNAGWNMIGSISDTISITCIVPLGTTVQSSYFGYTNGYVASDIILPGKAYWVKVSTAGQLVLKSCGAFLKK